MNLHLDTHALLWFLWDDPQLSAKAKASIEDPANRKLISIVSCWELAIKASVGKLTLGEPVHSFVAREIARNSFEFMPIALEHATKVETLPFHHRDPFDRLLIAQSLVEQIPIVSHDALFDAYGVTRVW